MTNPISEAGLVTVLKDYLAESDYYVAEEFAILQRRVDLVAWRDEPNTLIAIEAKVKDWQKGLKQAVSCLLFAEEVYMALAEDFVHRVQIDDLKRYGIGLMKVNSHVELILPAQKSKYRSEYHMSWAAEKLAGKSQGDKKHGPT